MRQPSSPDGLVASARPATIATTAAKRPPTALTALLVTTTPPYTSPVFGLTGGRKPPFCSVYPSASEPYGFCTNAAVAAAGTAALTAAPRAARRESAPCGSWSAPTETQTRARKSERIVELDDKFSCCEIVCFSRKEMHCTSPSLCTLDSRESCHIDIGHEKSRKARRSVSVAVPMVRWQSLCVVLLALSTADARSATPSASRATDSRRRSKATPCQPAVSLSRDTSFLRSAVAGGAAACVATVAFHPVDTIKTMLQQQGLSATGLRRSQLSARVLYRGVGPAAFSMMPACAARMASYEALKAALLRAGPHLPQGPLVVLASALSVVASGFVRSPLDMVKVQLQAGAAPSAAAAVQEALRGGVRGVYRGMGLALLRDVPFFSINLVVYETLKAQALLRKR
jgi:hypothetical protein